MYALPPAASHHAFHLTPHWVIAGAVCLVVVLLVRWLFAADGGLLAVCAFAGVCGLGVVLCEKARTQPAAAAPAPRPVPARTVIVQHTITRVVTHSPLSGWEIALIAIFGIAAACGVIHRGRGA